MGRANYAELKKSGFMRQVQEGHFSFRLRVTGGQLGAEKLIKIHDIAQRYGKGYIHMTSRQSLEIPHIKLEDVDAVKAELAEAGLQPGVSGPRVRTITACQGNTVCPSGLIDTTALSKDFDERYYARELPHKFKLGITGCRNNCLKAEENDIGIKGGMVPDWKEGNCNYCGICEAVCREKAIAVDKELKRLVYDKEACNYCGRCVKACPVGAWEGKSGFIVYFGGLFGNRIAVGKQLFPILFSTDVLHEVIETTLEFFKKHGKKSERFRNTLDRIGWELLQTELEGVVLKEAHLKDAIVLKRG